MPAFVVAAAHVSDPEALKAYHKRVAGVLPRYDGELVFSGDVTGMLEGEVAPGEKITVIKFPDEERARGYFNSIEYLEGKALRQGGVEMITRLIVK